jgi:hypothetical protein
MEKKLFTSMDMAENIQTFEDELRKLMDAFNNATKVRIHNINILRAYNPQRGNETRIDILVTK